MASQVSERRLVFLIGAVQFINVLDFMMLMPLGPDFALALGIPSSQLGLVGGAYTAAAAVTGVAGAFFLDRLDRRRALAVALVGLVLGTLAGGFATGLGSLLAARLVAGAFGGPAAALSLAIVADSVPSVRRGRAMSAVLSASSFASVLGVPAGLELARLAGWRTPFFAVGGLAALIATFVLVMLPAQKAHLGGSQSAAPTPFRAVLRRPVVLLALAAITVSVVAQLALVPNLSAYFQFNRGYPRAQLGLLYLVGGAMTFAAMRLAGWLSDRYGAPPVAAIGSLGFILVLAIGFIHPVAWLPVPALFVWFMTAGSFRYVSTHVLSSRVPAPSERARFMSAQSAAQHIAAAIGATIGALVLSEAPDGALVGMDDLAWLAVATAIALPGLLYLIDRRVPPPEPIAAEAGPTPEP